MADFPTDAGLETPPARDQRSLVRSLTESAVCLLIAVMLFRTFAAEGYMISTGSMAPHLLGFHKRVECPSCKHVFPFGVAYDTDPAGVSAAETDRQRSHAVCPNCGQTGINLADVPRNHGDQLLVFKPAYGFRPPERWEVVVFRNPHNPREAYVKRVVGLPDERVQIIDGDVYADGNLCRKDWDRQRQLRVLVHDHRYEPSDTPSHRPVWQPLHNNGDSAPGWTADGDRFVLSATKSTDWAWVEYAGGVPAHGRLETAVAPVTWPKDIDPTGIPPAGLKYDPREQRLSCIGPMPDAVRDALLSHPGDEAFHAKVRELYEQSHIAPVTDLYGYNPPENDLVPVPVRDVMIALTVQHFTGDGEFSLELTDGAANYTAVFDLGRHQLRLYAGEHSDPVSQDDLPADFGTAATEIEMSLFDRQVLVAINGEPVLSPWTFDTPADTPAPKYPVRFGGQSLSGEVSRLALYRDVYYTATRAKHGVQRPYKLEGDELFVLGDNSPVSHDSRRWPDGAVATSLLVGKPFVIHLPSKPGRLRIGNFETPLRLPDFERMQWLK
ncbi:MAG TPA: signal peptidase I [Planctomycetaceae bacterium]|nr:signal peptidase I [Planctomycetaceae bacterium]